MVAEKFGASLDQVCLIFAGKILKDPELLKTHHLKDGLTVHLVIKSGNRPTQESSNTTGSTQTTTTAQPTSQPSPSQTPFSLGGLFGSSGGLLTSTD